MGYDYVGLDGVILRVRESIVRMLTAAGSGHLGGSLSCADILTVLYSGGVLRVDPGCADDAGRDRFILSNGHVAPALYAALAHAGFFPEEELQGLRGLGSRLQGHPSLHHGLPGLDSSTGSLGQGLSVGVGMALAARLCGRDYRTFVLMGDGELQEGQVWEAAMSASHHGLDNLVGIVDYNGLQICGRTHDVMDIEPLGDKFRSFGWGVHEVDGHDVRRLRELLLLLRDGAWDGVPQVVLARTRMGCGVASITDNSEWHGKVPSAEECASFCVELAGYHAERLRRYQA